MAAMTPTKEQYELAAKFMGLQIAPSLVWQGRYLVVSSNPLNKYKMGMWEPLTQGDHAYELLIMALRNRYSMLEHQITIELGAEMLAAIDAGDGNAVAEKAFLVAVELGRLMP
jgi:hypothetical protein